MNSFPTLDDMDLQGKVVLTRVDINVPAAGGTVTDTTRIERIVPTIRDINAKGGKPVLLAHFGRPNGRPVPEMSLRVTVPALEAALGQPVTFMEKPSRDAIDALSADTIVLVENTRFTPLEEANDPRMATFLASLGDIYCNDAFSAAHRAHASTEGVARLLPSCAGRLMQEELSALQKALANPERPLVAIVGGAKVSTKIDLLENLIRKVDALIIGGGMANTFLAARGIGVGKSLCEHNLTDTARRIMAASADNECVIVLPEDGVYATEFAAHPDTVTDLVGLMPQDHMMLDAGPASADTIMQWIGEARTLVWNGPLGAFEIEPFDSATNVTTRFAARRTREGHLLSVAGGGDTVAALAHAGIAGDFSYVSTAGGAFLEWLEGKTLPGVAALQA